MVSLINFSPLDYLSALDHVTIIIIIIKTVLTVLWILC